MTNWEGGSWRGSRKPGWTSDAATLEKRNVRKCHLASRLGIYFERGRGGGGGVHKEWQTDSRHREENDG